MSFKYPEYTIQPTRKSDIGISKVKGKVGNEKYKIFFPFEFTVKVINDPPYFDKIDKELPGLEVSQRDERYMTLPIPTDKENLTVSIEVKE